MCGITCIVNTNGRQVDERLIERMNDAVAHRGPDGVGVEIRNCVGMGHRRLSILDLSARSNQPMKRGDGILVFNGEIYNYVELRADLIAEGHQFETESDTEVLLVALNTWGVGALPKLNGMFSFAYYSQANQTVLVARDQFGIKPLVYARTTGSIIFASEAKQILATKLISAEADRESIERFLAQGSLNTHEATFFKGIVHLKPGHSAAIDLKTGGMEVRAWYVLKERVKQCSDSYPVAREKVRELLIKSLQLRHRADVPLGAFLSGGIDSSTIVSLSVGLPSAHDLKTITTYSNNADYDERRFSRAVSDAFGLKGIEVCPPTELIWTRDTLVELATVHDQPIPSGSHYNEYWMFKAARENDLIVMLDGQGADEYFGGYGEFWFAAQMELLRSGRLSAFYEGISARSASTCRSRDKVMRSFVRTLASRRSTPPQSIGSRKVSWLSRDTKTISSQARSFLGLSIEELEETSLPYQLHSQDRSSMRWSVESRLPFLDCELVEYVLGLPAHYKVGNGFQKRILRDAVPELPEAIAKRTDKVGFVSPDSIALRTNVRDVRDQLREACDVFEDWIDGDVLTKAFDEMVLQNAWYDPLFFRIVGVNAWRSAFQVSVH